MAALFSTSSSSQAAIRAHLSRPNLSETFLELGPPDLTGQLHSTRDLVGSGSYGEVFVYEAKPQSLLWKTTSIKRFAVKEAKITVKQMKEDKVKRIEEKLLREVRIWSSLSHPNILKLHGLLLPEQSFPQLVSQYMEDGTAQEYAKQKEANIIQMVCDISAGLTYIHSKGYIHGDLKSNNLLVDPEGRVQIADFGMSRILDESGTPIDNSTFDGNRSSRYASPELLAINSESGPGSKRLTPTKGSDVWAFGSTVINLFSGESPYYNKTPGQVVLCLHHREKPEFPDACANPNFEPYREIIFVLCHMCWIVDPNSRPEMIVIQAFLNLYSLKHGSSNPCNSHHDYLSGEQGDTQALPRRSVSMPLQQRNSRQKSPCALHLDFERLASSLRQSSINEEHAIPNTPPLSSPSESVGSGSQSSSPLSPRDNGSPTLRRMSTSTDGKPWKAHSAPAAPCTRNMLRPGSTPRAHLNHICQTLSLRPKFEGTMSGQSHCPCYEQAIIIDGEEYGRAQEQGRKQNAIESASLLALERLDRENPSDRVLSYLPTFDSHIRNNHLSTNVRWELQRLLGQWSATVYFDGVVLASCEGQPESDAKEKAARAAATRWRRDVAVFD